MATSARPRRPRADPRLTAQYTLAKPAKSHRRPASCAEVNCKFYRLGWQMRIMENTPLGERQVALVKQSGRRFRAERAITGPGEVLLTFEAGQQCFGAHSVPNDRPALYVVRQGTSQPRLHTKPENWVEDFSTHLDKIREQ